MDVGSIAQLSTTMAETGTRQAVGLTVLKKAQDIQSSTATALLAALPPVQSAPSLPAHLGNRIKRQPERRSVAPVWRFAVPMPTPPSSTVESGRFCLSFRFFSCSCQVD